MQMISNRWTNRLAVVALLFCGTACLAQPAAKGGDDKQRAAPERLLLQIKAVQKRGDELVADAEVKKVHASQAGLKAGEPVRIMYRHQNTGAHFKSVAGDVPVPAVEQGKLYEAYLQKRGAVFVPVAGERSFVAPR
jgi:hypothetical protein